MKEKIASALKTRYANLGLGEKAFNGVASFLEKTVTDEAMIDSAIAEPMVVGFLKDLQSENDKLRGEKSTAVKALEDYKKAHPEVVVPPANTDDANAKAIAELKSMIEAQNAKITENEKKIRREDLVKSVREKMKSNGSDNDFILNISLANVEISDEDTVDTVASRYKSVYDSNYKAAYGNGAIPPKSTNKPEGYKEGNYKSQIEALQKEGLIPKSN